MLSLQELQGDILDEYGDDDNNNDPLGVEYNATVYAGGKNTVDVVSQAGLSASPSSANVFASIGSDPSTCSRNGLIAAANEALRVQRLLEYEVAAFQEAMLSMWSWSQINNSSISGYQVGALWANHWLKRKDLCIISLTITHYAVKGVFRIQKLFLPKM